MAIIPSKSVTSRSALRIFIFRHMRQSGFTSNGAFNCWAGFPEQRVHVFKCRHWVNQHHARTREAHDLAYLFPLIRLVAMYRALATYGFIWRERTARQPQFSVFQQILAGFAYFPAGVVFAMAINANHLSNGFAFFKHSVSHRSNFTCYSKFSFTDLSG